MADLPTGGGRYQRDPKTGALTPVAPPPAPPPAPAPAPPPPDTGAAIDASQEYRP